MEIQEVNAQGQDSLDRARKTALCVVGLLVLLTVMAAVLANNGLRSVAAAGTPPALTAFQDELQIQLNGNGFTPSEVQHAAGTFAIAVENSSLENEYTLRLKATDGTVLKEIAVQKGSAVWTITLAAGQYTLTEASHPQWLCQITVQ